MLTAAQIRAGRALLRWSAQDLATKADVGISTVQRMEAAEGVPSASSKNLEAVQRVMEEAGVEFLPPGLSLSAGGAGVRLKDRQG